MAGHEKKYNCRKLLRSIWTPKKREFNNKPQMFVAPLFLPWERECAVIHGQTQWENIGQAQWGNNNRRLVSVHWVDWNIQRVAANTKPQCVKYGISQPAASPRGTPHRPHYLIPYEPPKQIRERECRSGDSNCNTLLQSVTQTGSSSSSYFILTGTLTPFWKLNIN